MYHVILNSDFSVTIYSYLDDSIPIAGLIQGTIFAVNRWNHLESGVDSVAQDFHVIHESPHQFALIVLPNIRHNINVANP